MKNLKQTWKNIINETKKELTKMNNQKLPPSNNEHAANESTNQKHKKHGIIFLVII